VIVLGYTIAKDLEESWSGPWRLVRAPVRWTLRDARRPRMARRWRRRPPFLRTDVLAHRAILRRLGLRPCELGVQAEQARRVRDSSGGLCRLVDRSVGVAWRRWSPPRNPWVPVATAGSRRW
jgi:hypothetical protein